MHLRRYYKKNQEAETQQPVVIDHRFNWDTSSLPKEVRELAATRKTLQDKITQIETRLRFGYSNPLYDYKMQLVKEDVLLSCKMTDLLIPLAKK